MSISTTFQVRMGAALAALCLLAGVGGLAQRLRADVFQLTGGGRLEGMWLDRDQQNAGQYHIELRGGGRIVLAAAAVRELAQDPPLEHQYQLYAATRPDTIQGHWAVAQWCQERGLKHRRREHLQQLLRLDPDHGPARRALGFTFVRGQWVTQQQYMEQRGYVRYRNGWHLPQEVELQEARRAREAAQLQWMRQLTVWRRALGSDEQGKPADAIAAVRDPDAVVPLAQLLQQESVRAVRMLYVRTIANIGTAAAQHALLNIGLADGDEEVMHCCYDHLAQLASPEIHQRAVDALRHKQNWQVNRAAMLLQRLRYREDIGVLIDALVTQHELPFFNRSTQQWELRTYTFQNRDVFAALVAVSGKSDFGFDQQAWRQWQLMEARREHELQAGQTAVGRDLVGASQPPGSRTHQRVPHIWPLPGAPQAETRLTPRSTSVEAASVR